MTEELSEREQQVYELLVHGTTNKQIANHLGIVEKTVKTHITAVFKKLGFKNRSQAIAQYYKRKDVTNGPEDASKSSEEGESRSSPEIGAVPGAF